jgi:hypothetical protein
MLSLSVFKVSFKKFLSNSDLISESDLEKIASLDIESSFDYEKDECYFCYIITNQIEIEKYKKILEKNYIGYTCKDISEYIIKNEYDIDYIGDYLDENNYYFIVREQPHFECQTFHSVYCSLFAAPSSVGASLLDSYLMV